MIVSQREEAVPDLETVDKVGDVHGSQHLHVHPGVAAEHSADLRDPLHRNECNIITRFLNHIRHRFPDVVGDRVTGN